ncbi:MAG: M48 family metallopeptidase [Marinomonas sp.]|uniref:M48 metallopeptidase family protein n=1 Tax=Marinomonas sp. S3726 TaxID=579484 RepID=UPI0005F9DFEC|nr:YgjP-like metallopeptidase domain-containing protein [Marinomonas sp. S3726]KJZ12412.1 metal-dependent hydrolase [Marinomonas sp. S3726]
MNQLKYISAYPNHLQNQIQTLIDQDKLANYLLSRFPEPHKITNDKALRDYVSNLKNQYMKKSANLSKIQYDNKIHLVNNALGMHSYVSRIQGNKLKSKNELRISTLFKNAPIQLLNMICVHELAHLKEKEHNKAFYQLCQYMLSDYHQLEFDARVYLTQVEFLGEIY